MNRNLTFLLALSYLLSSCGGDQATQVDTGNTKNTNSADNSSITRNVTENPMTIDFQTADLSEYIVKDKPIFINKEEQLVTQLPGGDDTYFTLNTANDLEKFLSTMKKEEKARYDCWGMHDKLYDVFYEADLEKPILDRHILAQKVLSEKEIKYYKLWFMLTLKDNTENPENAFFKIRTKLNQLCRECASLSEEQLKKLEAELKENNSFGVFEEMRVQQINSYGI